MSGKTFVGNRASSLKESDKLQPYTKVTVTDGTNSYSSGTDTGRELLVEVPVLPNGDGATLAANILNSVKNYQYRPYEADSALLDPAAELGDGITVGGVYGGIHAKTATFSRLFRANVSAPAEEEIDSEYPYLSAQERDAVRQKKQTAKNTADIAGNTADIAGNTASIRTLNTQVAQIGNLVANKASISDLSAAVGRISSLESSVANFGEVYAEKASVTNLSTRIGSIESLFTNNVYSGKVDSTSVATLALKVGGTAYSQKTIQFQNKSGTWQTFTVLGSG